MGLESGTYCLNKGLSNFEIMMIKVIVDNIVDNREMIVKPSKFKIILKKM